MASQNIENYRQGAEVYHGNDVCQKNLIDMLKELELPMGLLPVVNIAEFGYNRSAGFMWINQEKKKEHMFKKIKRAVSYDSQVTAFVEKRKMKKVTGVKTKELFFWLTVVELYIDNTSLDKIIFKSSSGLSDNADVAAFALDA